MRVSRLTLPAGLLTFLLPCAMALLPYNPTTILSSPAHNDTLYIFQQGNSTVGEPELVGLNISGTLSPTALSTTTISQSLPFAAEEDTLSYVPLIDSRGTIYVYSGQCEDGADGASLWAFTPMPAAVNGIWKQQDISKDGTFAAYNYEGANFLAAGMDFSSTGNGSSDIYIFGGMCPNSTTSNIQTWQSSANYSNSMLVLQPPSASTGDGSEFVLSTVSSPGPPIAEAGFTVTALQPTYFSSSYGGTNQQQNFVLLGGHTQTAFINMSQVALFSLPQQSWAFLPVDDPSMTPKMGLTVRNADMIDPRSGHTAVLTSDGKQIVVYGGWVGDVTTPASPQLAILQLGEDYGGTGDWQWTIPEQKGAGPPDGAGLYGHGAVMLPGEVVMVVGGFSTSSQDGSSSTSSGSAQNTAAYFFNVTSSTWLSMYTNPAVGSLQSNTPSNGSGTSSTARNAGLGAGLGVGLAALGGLLVLYLCYRHRVKRRKSAREKDLRELAIGAQRFHSSALGLGGIDGRGGEHSAVEWMGREGQDAYPWAPSLSGLGGNVEAPGGRGARKIQAERTGLLVEVPSPTRGLRRSLHSRGSAQQPSWYDDGRRSRASGNIHPIDERDEYEEYKMPTQEMAERNNVDLLTTMPNLDPFLDPLGSHPIGVSRTPSPQSPAREREREVQNWVADWNAAENIMQQHAGRMSPEKTDRTSSTLSEQSTYSTVSALSMQQSAGTISRSISQRSGALLRSNPFSFSNRIADSSATFDARNDYTASPEQRPDYRRTHSLTLDHAHQRTNTAESFVTASTSFSRLQAEGETLLGAHCGPGDLLPSRSQSRAKGWVGTVRRAFTGGGSGSRSISRSPEPGHRSTSSSPTKCQYSDVGIPRRAASTGAMLWRRRQGAKDWNVEDGVKEQEAKGMAADAGGDDDEWDVESAVERRVVQVMFTVPKERLRVVNAGPEGDGESILSLERDTGQDRGMTDGKGKQKELLGRSNDV